MFQELSESIKSSLYERISSPLIGSVVFSWLAMNWKGLLYFLFSKSNIEDRIAYVSIHYTDINLNLTYPIIFGAIISVIYPICSAIPFFVSEQFSYWERNFKKKCSMKELLSVEQSLQLRQELMNKETRIREILAENQKEKDTFNYEMEKLKQENMQLIFKLSELDVDVKDIEPKYIKLSAIEDEILRLHTGLDDNIQIISDVAEELSIPEVDVNATFEKLKEKGFIEEGGVTENDSGENVSGYILTDYGRKYLAYKKLSVTD